ncbi:MAG: FHA domain-containing protein, partial [Chloroflexia bacterium]
EVPTSSVPIPAASGVVPIPTGQPSAAVPGTNGAGTTSGGFPWLILIILLVVIALGVVALIMARSRNTMAPAGRPAPQDPNRARPYAVTPPASASLPNISAGATGAPTMPIPAVVPAASGLPATLTCPNCNTVNDWNENFCHDCGQDLRPVRASIMATIAPPADVVTDDMPYLETLDRADEQLEYVLSRGRIVIGSAAGCDIMVDKTFANNATVAARHAQLTRNADGSFSVTDLGSPAGTFVNNTQVAANTSAQLTDGVQIRAGNVRFVYRVP